MIMNRREFSLSALAMAIAGKNVLASADTGSKYQIVDAQIHVWINDPHYPWAAETRNPPKENRTPAMALELMKSQRCSADGDSTVYRVSLGQSLLPRFDPAICAIFPRRMPRRSHQFSRA